MDWNYAMTDYIVCFQTFNLTTLKWDCEQKIFNSEAKAKEFGAEILNCNPYNKIIIKSSEYAITFENDVLDKKYTGKENNIFVSTPETRRQLLQEVYPHKYAAKI